MGEYDSRIEFFRHTFLLEKERQGEIKNLRRQVKFVLIPTQKKTRVVQLKTKTKIEEYVAEREVAYIADFMYERNGETIVEDCKGVSKKKGKEASEGDFANVSKIAKKGWTTETPDFIIKRKLMLYIHGITLKIVGTATEWGK